MNRMPLPLLHEAIPTLTWVFLALSLSACSRSATEICSSGLVCPPGWACTADGQACIQGHCGDGIRQEDEACDDGNTQSGDGCNSTCTSDESCGNGVLDPNEACDDGNTVNDETCSANCLHAPECGNGFIDEKEECDPPGDREGFTCSRNCKIAFCGNGKIDEGEECDDGNTSDDDSCLNTCRLNICGDGHRNPDKEACDDGNQVTEAACPYGTKDCTLCNDNCTAELALNGAYCGDGRQDPNEACDDGPANGTKRCPYGLENCKVCNADCSAREDGTVSYCGDGTKDDLFEDCDFGHDACGTCTARCKHIDPKQAQGSITVTNIRTIANDHNGDGDTLVISDGWRLPLILILSKNCTTQSHECHMEHDQAHCCVQLGNKGETESQLTNYIRDAINEVYSNPVTPPLLNISAEIEPTSPPVIQLTHGAQASWGNQPIKTNNTDGLQVEGMSGGVGHDCVENSLCDSDDDCVFGLQCQSDKHCRY